MIDLSLLDPRRGLCFHSHGMGQQSAAITALLTDPSKPEFFERYVGDRNLIVLHADTNNESEDTVAFRAWTAEHCRERRITYATVDSSLGFHRGAWTGGLTGQWDANHTVGSVTFPSTCSDSLKISPLYNCLADVLHRLYGFESGRKNEFYRYVERFGDKLPVLIGFGRGEESRAGLTPSASCGQLDLISFLGTEIDTRSAGSGRVWMDRCIEKAYPLIDLGMNRADCQEYLRSRGLPTPPPSMCEFCHWSSHAQVEAMRRFQPEKLDTWIEYEQRKIEAWADRAAASGSRNAFVKGTISLVEFAQQAQRQYASFSDDALRDHIFSHGHEVRSRH